MLKKTLYTLILALLIVKTAAAQGDYHFGFQLSPSFSWLSTDNQKINGNGSVLGLKLGLIIERRFSDNYAFTTGFGFHFNSGGKLLYDQPGNFWKNSAADAVIPYTANDTFQTNTELKYNLHFVEIPFGLKMRTQEFGMFRYFAEPMLILGLRYNAKGSIRNSPKFDQEQISIANDVGAINLAWSIGGGLEYTIANNTTLVGGLYYQQGFVDIQKNGNTIFTAAGAKADASKATIQAITLKIGVMF